MMRELIIIAEGSTEEEFIKNCVRPYLSEVGIHTVTPIQVTTSRGFKGGIGKGGFQKLKNDALRYLRQRDDVIVTTLIDYYHLPTDFPEYLEAMKSPQAEHRVEHLEGGMSRSVGNARFIPYIQLHEFEALLFSGMDGFMEIPDLTRLQLLELQTIVDSHSNPETINNGEATSPSNRLMNIIPEYQKNFHGSYIPLANGFESILASCPRFKFWIETLIARMKEIE